jgi:hypothetical protein
MAIALSVSVDETVIEQLVHEEELVVGVLPSVV